VRHAESSEVPALQEEGRGTKEFGRLDIKLVESANEAFSSLCIEDNNG
jgi:hypothetical protein